MRLTHSRAELGRRGDWLSVTFLLGALLFLFYVVPLVALVAAQPPSRVVAQLSTPTVLGAVRTSVAGATLSTVLAAVFGLPLAYWLARTESRLSTLVTACVVLPLVLPPVVSGMVLLTVVGPNTLVGGVAGCRSVL